jgi:hypothetical protein
MSSTFPSLTDKLWHPALEGKRRRITELLFWLRDRQHSGLKTKVDDIVLFMLSRFFMHRKTVLAYLRELESLGIIEVSGPGEITLHEDRVDWGEGAG